MYVLSDAANNAQKGIVCGVFVYNIHKPEGVE